MKVPDGTWERIAAAALSGNGDNTEIKSLLGAAREAGTLSPEREAEFRRIGAKLAPVPADTELFAFKLLYLEHVVQNLSDAL